MKKLLIVCMFCLGITACLPQIETVVVQITATPIPYVQLQMKNKDKPYISLAEKGYNSIFSTTDFVNPGVLCLEGEGYEDGYIEVECFSPVTDGRLASGWVSEEEVILVPVSSGELIPKPRIFWYESSAKSSSRGNTSSYTSGCVEYDGQYEIVFIDGVADVYGGVDSPSSSVKGTITGGAAGIEAKCSGYYRLQGVDWWGWVKISDTYK